MIVRYLPWNVDRGQRMRSIIHCYHIQCCHHFDYFKRWQTANLIDISVCISVWISAQVSTIRYICWYTYMSVYKYKYWLCKQIWTPMMYHNEHVSKQTHRSKSCYEQGHRSAQWDIRGSMIIGGKYILRLLHIQHHCQRVKLELPDWIPRHLLDVWFSVRLLLFCIEEKVAGKSSARIRSSIEYNWTKIGQLLMVVITNEIHSLWHLKLIRRSHCEEFYDVY